MTLTEFLLARIAEDEAAARAVPPLEHNYDMGGNRQDERWYVSRLRFSSADGAARSEQDVEASQLFARHDPARVLAECEAKQRIVGFHGYVAATEKVEAGACWDCHSDAPGPCRTLRALALPYADHADYDESWRS